MAHPDSKIIYLRDQIASAAKPAGKRAKVQSMYDQYPLPFFDGKRRCAWSAKATGRYFDGFETGRVTLDEYLRRTVFYREHTFTPDDFKKFMFDQSQPFPDSLDFLKKLAQTRRYMLASLNNESKELNEYRIKTFRLRNYFEAFFSSCYLALRKPNIEIYKLALKIAQREPEECVMIDDRGLNLETAKEIGMNIIQFRSVAQLRGDLEKLHIVAD